jgi:hypothetical protein
MFTKDSSTSAYFKENGILDTTANLSETEQQSKESLIEWRKIYKEN